VEHLDLELLLFCSSANYVNLLFLLLTKSEHVFSDDDDDDDDTEALMAELERIKRESRGQA
jgi:hypothetical protein